ncbi:hypothetical protein AGR1B_Lc70023 [Agrobacterium fabacearum S56]|nr:hypothetical protein AGR1B_Lc70023 [Agrobacterium fabacearum S56]
MEELVPDIEGGCGGLLSLSRPGKNFAYSAIPRCSKGPSCKFVRKRTHCFHAIFRC